MKADNVSIQRIRAGSEFQVDGAETENAPDENLVVMPEGLPKDFCWKNVKLRMEGSEWLVQINKSVTMED